MSDTQYRGNKGVKKYCCIECELHILEQKKRAVERTAKWRESKKDIKSYRAKEARKYRAVHPEKVREGQKRWYYDNHAKIREYHSTYRKSHPEINRVSASKRRVSVKQRTPIWANTQEIKDFYKICPEGLVVDHIIPLKGSNVSGLHVLSNLRYVTFEENAKKWRYFNG